MSVTLVLRTRPRLSCLLAALATLGCGTGAPSPGTAGAAGFAGSAGGSVAGSAGNGGAGGGGSMGGMAGTGGTGGAEGGSAGSGGAAGSAGAGGAGGGSAGGCVMSKADADQPVLLSETGCIDMADPTQPAAGLVPYSVRSPLWSDAAEKERFIRVPDGMKIHALDCAVETALCDSTSAMFTGEDDGHWQLPIGTVLVKNFSIEGQHIETRLLMRRTNTVWKGFSYEWNDEQTQANLLPDDAEHAFGKEKPVGSGQIWHYPSRSQCQECHTKYAGRSLGPSTPQLNSDFAYAEGTMNQIDKFEQLGLFDAPPKDIAGLPDPFGADALDVRARSYLQTNCAICHRPGGEFNSIDMRFTTAFEDMNLCDPVERDAGLVPDYRLVPGNPAQSTMSFRMHAVDDVRMPKIGSNVVDPQGSKLIDDWITSLAADVCPPQPPL
jgi:uncharacterized repeat protein (TIGR03806 family)